MSMGIQAWLGETPQQKFVEQYYGRLPFALQGAAAAACPLGSWDTIGTILEDPASDVMVVQSNQQFPTRPQDQGEAERLADEGKTILIRHAEQHHAGLRELADQFHRDFGGVVNIHIYATPGAQYGFGWHYDAEEVFILQTTGRKRYSLRKNTVNPWPLPETLPADMQYHRELMPLMRCSLERGDWLYIPAGYWHMGEADETAISLAVGVMPPTAMDLFDQLRGDLLDSMLWRQRLPLAAEAAILSPEQREDLVDDLLEQLGRDLQKRLQTPQFRQRVLEELATGPAAQNAESLQTDPSPGDASKGAARDSR